MRLDVPQNPLHIEFRTIIAHYYVAKGNPMQPARLIIRMTEVKHVLPAHNWLKPMLIELQLAH